MVEFNIIHKEFESTKDISGFTQKYSDNRCGIRYLLLRSLDTPHLSELLKVSISKYEGLLKQAYNSTLTTDAVLSYIESKRQEIDEVRNAAEEGLHDIILNFGPVNCGLRNDKVDDIVKSLVRDKTIKTIEELNERIEYILPRLGNYIRWSFYNQTTNDLIEHIFIKHPKIIPTLRKIHHIDVFLKIGDSIIPFDLKFTHISDDFFDLYSMGLIDAVTGNDDYEINSNGKSEIEMIKEYYKNNKKSLKLPNFGGLSKKEIICILSEVDDPKTQTFVESIYRNRYSLINNITGELKKLEWWNYKYQGERLFSNNNRLFLFLAYNNDFEDGRPIKGKLDIIEKNVNAFLDSITLEEINTIKYHYDKDPSLVGDYSAFSKSILIRTDK